MLAQFHAHSLSEWLELLGLIILILSMFVK
jgi:hypothetical protein